MDVGAGQLRAVNRQCPHQVPVLQAGEGSGVIVFIEAAGQLGGRGFIKGLEPLGGDRWATALLRLAGGL